MATLVGSVADANEANFVAAVAWRVDGIVSVTNQLQFDDQPL
ncbi:BON domain-containing protein [Burkholderia cepacia]|nr:BON domain-containing protein [Burkholderia cepacia]MCA7891746.1 BON domain-containing protein [Burkholderia cepacia]MDN7615302.1 BON domain-containing protein [Burkholderia cepacia]